jgi:aminopeptidase N
MTENLQPQPIFLKDYQAPDYLIPTVNLEFNLNREKTLVRSTLNIKRNQDIPDNTPLRLNGSENLVLVRVKLNNIELAANNYEIIEKDLIIANVPEAFTLEVITEINPMANQSGAGLYQSNGNFCTQMEPEGFRKVTFFSDRPDVMSIYTTKIIGAQDTLPILLSNGNLIDQGELPEGLHYATWNDPFPKPCYLFALVAGNLGVVKDTFITKSGREIAIAVYVDHGNEGRTQHAIDSLKRSMKWDEEVFNLEYDLDQFMIVAVNDFNAGAMENKGLNIFNASLVLADPQTATDDNFLRIESVVAHEFFHNWTGNRVTCRDWFQLTLKEGLTVFRDQLFSADMNSPAVQRIQEAKFIKTYQFAEDEGHNSHPIRPESYIEINNFYTSTIYDKGSEVIRMIYTLIGSELFTKGIAKYFELYDGQAVTTEDFLNAMHLASGLDLTQFQRWYNQAGTPLVWVQLIFNRDQATCELIVEQSCPSTPGQQEKLPFYLPLSLGFLAANGSAIPLVLDNQNLGTTATLVIKEEKQRFVFTDVKERPVISLLRNFSAPVKLSYDYTVEELLHLLSFDTDLVSRYEAAERLTYQAISSLNQSPEVSREIQSIVTAFGLTLSNPSIDSAFRSLVLTMPPLSAIVASMNPIDYEQADKGREAFIQALAEGNHTILIKTFTELAASLQGAYSLKPEIMAQRALKNTILDYLVRIDEQFFDLTYTQLVEATNMTDEFAALRILVNYDSTKTEEAIAHWYKKWQQDPLVMNKWFQAQASSRLANVSMITRLETHPCFDKYNPNKLRVLYRTFASNPLAFHTLNGEGYRLIADKIIEIDSYNSNIAANLATSFYQYQKLDPIRKQLMANQLSKILNTPGISPGVYEITSKTYE